MSCNKLPLVTIHQLDTVHGVANPFKITKYDNDKCTVETTQLSSFPIAGKELHGGFCLTKEDFAKFKAYLQSECKNNKKGNTP